MVHIFVNGDKLGLIEHLPEFPELPKHTHSGNIDIFRTFNELLGNAMKSAIPIKNKKQVKRVLKNKIYQRTNYGFIAIGNAEESLPLRESAIYSIDNEFEVKIEKQYKESVNYFCGATIVKPKCIGKIAYLVRLNINPIDEFKRLYKKGKKIPTDIQLEINKRFYETL